MELEVLKAKLEELGKILLAEDGFFAQMPKEQLDAFGEAIKLMARIQTLEVLNEKLSNGFIAKIMPKIDDVSVMEPISTTNFGPMMTETHCPKCMAMPCMCANQISANEFGSSDGLMGDMPMDFPEDTK